MFELGKKDGDAGQSSSSQRAAASAPAAPAGSSAAKTSGPGHAIIGRSIQIQGDVKGDEDLVIEGKVSGTVELKNSSLTIGREGTVRANVYARSISVEGTTDGDLFASERITIRASADVRGNLLAPSIALEDGARFKGSVEMDPQAVEKAIGPSQTKPASRPDAPASKPEMKPAGQPAAAGAGN